MLFMGFYLCCAWDFVILGIAPESIQMQTDISNTGVAAGGDEFVIGNRVLFQSPFTVGIKALGYTVIDNIHHTANCTTAIKQGGWAAQDFDLARSRCLCGYCMVGANARCIACVQTVLGNQYT